MSMTLNRTSTNTLANNKELVIVTCPNTGISIEMIVPVELKDLYLKYDSPLSQYKNLKSFIELPYSKLKDLNESFLAGLVLGIYNHYELLTYKQDAIISNAVLRTAGKEWLIRAVLLSRQVTKAISKYIPNLNIEYIDYSDLKITDTFSPYLKNFLENIEEALEKNNYSAKIEEGIGIIKVKHSFDVNAEQNLNPVYLRMKGRINKTTKNDYQVQFEKDYKEARGKAVESFRMIKIALIQSNYKKLVEFLNTNLQGNLLLNLDKKMLETVSLKVRSAYESMPIDYQGYIDNISHLVTMALSYDDKTDVNSLFEKGMNDYVQANLAVGKKLSLKELLAKKIQEAKDKEAEEEMNKRIEIQEELSVYIAEEYEAFDNVSTEDLDSYADDEEGSL